MNSYLSFTRISLLLTDFVLFILIQIIFGLKLKFLITIKNHKNSKLKSLLALKKSASINYLCSLSMKKKFNFSKDFLWLKTYN